jgi:hypothetical protein
MTKSPILSRLLNYSNFFHSIQFCFLNVLTPDQLPLIFLDLLYVTVMHIHVIFDAAAFITRIS